MKNIHFRLEDNIYAEIEEMAVPRGTTPSQILRELIELGLRVKKHMDGKKEEKKEELPINKHLEIGASSSIEGLLLLRKMADHINEQWVKEAHEEAGERVKKMKEQ
jgi:hypothetical protein